MHVINAQQQYDRITSNTWRVILLSQVISVYQDELINNF